MRLAFYAGSMVTINEIYKIGDLDGNDAIAELDKLHQEVFNKLNSSS